MFEQAFRNIDDILREGDGRASELDCAAQTSWQLFLKHLDGPEQNQADETELEEKHYTHILDNPYRWDALASPNGWQSFRHMRFATHLLDTLPRQLYGR
jgi:type I restriction enzyme M protein